MKIFFENHRRAIVAIMLLAIFTIGLINTVSDSAIVDEIAHIPAGYSYVAYQDYRLNPEHPPFLKDLAGLPLLFLHLTFPLDNQAWTTDVNGQWEAGWNFLYHYGNNPEQILFFSRLPILLLAVLFGWLIYFFVRRNFGTLTALLTLFFYALSPNFLAHSHFVTTDLGIAFAIFLALFTFAEFLQKPSKKSFTIAILALALAQVTKFSAVLLIPFYFGVMLIVLLFTKNTLPFNFFFANKIKSAFWSRAYRYFISYAVMMVTMLLLVWIFYIPHVWNFPPEKQVELINTSLPADVLSIPRQIYGTMTHNKTTQALAQYLLGVTMVFGRVAGGNTTYFLGEVSNQSFKWYFPVSYLLKEPLALLFLVFLGVMVGCVKWLSQPIKKWWALAINTVKTNQLKLILFLFIIFYGGISIIGNLNLGIRHLFPILTLVYVLTADTAVAFFSGFQGSIAKKIAASLLGLLLFWYALSTAAAFPNYLSYFNELIGSGKNAYLYFTDSNVDWGQDLKRFKTWVDKHPEINKIKLDYFGGGEPKYYFCKRMYDEKGQLIRSSAGYDCSNSVYEEYHIQYGPAKGWIAVSVTFLQNAKYYAQRFGQQDYDWLRWQEPYAKIGNSIFVYRVR